jgi:Icc-related predicted phosphoesterase
MKEIDTDPDYILILGDVVAHSTMKLIINGIYNKELNRLKVQETLRNVSETLRIFFPSTQVIPVIGNNDAYDHYDMPTGYFKFEYLNFVYSLWRTQSNIPSTFMENGYYSFKTKTGENIICLNTLLFSYKQNIKLRSWAQLIWLKSQLEVLDKVIIAMHIPPGFSLFNGGSQSWHDCFIDAFRDIIEQYSQKILSIHGGHYHNSYFTFIDSITVFINPAISPLFGNNPGFRYFNKDGKDFQDVVFNGFDQEKNWKIYKFSQRFGYLVDYHRVFQELKEDVIDFEEYLKSVTGFTDVDQKFYPQACVAVFGIKCIKSRSFLIELALCAFRWIRSDEFLRCSNNIVTQS